MLGEQVGGVLGAKHFVQIDAAISDTLLYPEALYVDMAQLAQALPIADAQGSRAVCPDAQRLVEAKVRGHCLIAQARSSRAEHAVKLRLAGRGGDERLRGRPRLYQVATQHDAPTRRGLPGPRTSRPAGWI